MNSTALRRLIVTELLLALREPGAMFMALILPLAVFLALGFSVGVIEIPVERDTGITEIFHVRDVLLAGNIAWVAAVFGIVALPQTLVEFRQHGIFRRYRVTPMPSYMLIIAPLAVGAAVIAVSLALMLVVGWLVLDIRFGGNAAMVALAILVSYLAFAALGTAVTARIRNTRTGLGMGLALFAPMLVLSGAFGPRQAFPRRAPTGGRLAAADARLRSAHVPLAGRDLGDGNDHRCAHLGLLCLPGRDGGGLRGRQRTSVPVGLS